MRCRSLLEPAIFAFSLSVSHTVWVLSAASTSAAVLAVASALRTADEGWFSKRWGMSAVGITSLLMPSSVSERVLDSSKYTGAPIMVAALLRVDDLRGCGAQAGPQYPK